MASKTSGGGTSIFIFSSLLVALVFLVTTLVLFAKVQELTNNVALAQTDLDAAVRSGERDDRWQVLQQIAQADGRQGVVRYLDSALRDISEKVTGSRRDEPQIVSQRIEQALGGNASSLLGLVNSLQSEVKSLEGRIVQSEASRDAARADMLASDDRIADIQRTHDETLSRATSEFDDYKARGDQYAADIESTRQQFETRLQQIQSDSDATIRSLEGEIAELESGMAIASDQLRTLRSERGDDELRPSFEGALVDGRILGINAATGDISIDRGRHDRLVLGLSFEVYPGGSSIRPLSNGNYPQGKASIEIIRIGDNSSVARVIRRTSGNPILVGDSIANAVYDPTKEYSFAVFGNFDTSGDGIFTPQERQDIASLISEWGGQASEHVQGDTDFLVLGRRPVLPPEPRPSDPVELIQRYLLMKQELQKYDDMFRQAQATGIPVLNQNRLYTLTGLRGRR